MKTTSLILVAVLCCTVVGCASRHVANPDRWRSQAAKVTIGMTRGEVEKLLPPHPKSPLTTGGTGGSQSVAYWVDEHWCVSIAYDYTGVPRDEKGMALDMASPQNKVLTKPILSQEAMPVVDVKSIETIEQSDGETTSKPAPFHGTASEASHP
jgi:hypothetical protein